MYICRLNVHIIKLQIINLAIKGKAAYVITSYLFPFGCLDAFTLIAYQMNQSSYFIGN